jgi:hypothetical protein
VGHSAFLNILNYFKLFIKVLIQVPFNHWIRCAHRTCWKFGRTRQSAAG